jgi:hypothetical protein
MFLIYMVGGVCSAFTRPALGRWLIAWAASRLCGLIIVASFVTLAIANAGRLPVWMVLVLAACSSRSPADGSFRSSHPLFAVPSRRRGSFMSLTSCTRDLTSGSLQVSVAGCYEIFYGTARPITTSSAGLPLLSVSSAFGSQVEST